MSKWMSVIGLILVTAGTILSLWSFLGTKAKSVQTAGWQDHQQEYFRKDKKKVIIGIILIVVGTILQIIGIAGIATMTNILDFFKTNANYIGIIASFVGIIVSIMAIIQASHYKRASDKLNQKTEQIQQFIKQSIIQSNFINMYTFIGMRESIESNTQSVSLYKDKITFMKSNYNDSDYDKCIKIIYESNLIKENAYSQTIADFLHSDNEKVIVSLKSEINKNTINDFLKMVNSLLDYNIYVFHNIHFETLERTNQ